MAWSQAELDALKAAYAAGTTRVEYEGKVVQYPSGTDLLRRIRIIEAEVKANAGQKKPVAGFARFSRG